MDDLADTLERLAAEGGDAFYRGELAAPDVRAPCRSAAARSPSDDLAAYRVIRRRPVRAAFRGASSSRTRRRPRAAC